MDSTSPKESAWIPVLRLDAYSWLGFVGTSLYVGSQSKPRREVDPSNPVGLLPCLERARRSVVSDLSERETELGWTPGSLVARIPLRLLSSVAVSSRQNYWVLRALEWLEGETLDASERSLLDEIDRADWASQRARHRARRMLRAASA